MTVNKKRGDFGEAAVCDYIAKQGYKILARNYRKRVGEIDIIAIDKSEIVFIEVKTRKFGSMTDGGDSVNFTKQQKIIKTAKAFLKENPQYYNTNARFDVAQVTITTDEVPQLLELEYYKDAFSV